MLIKEEFFIGEDGEDMKKEYYGLDEEHITCTVTVPVPQEVSCDEDKVSEISVSNEEIQAQILLNQADIIAKQQEQEEVLAAILLNQMKGGERDV